MYDLFHNKNIFLKRHHRSLRQTPGLAGYEEKMTGAGGREQRECEPEPCLLKGQSVGRGLLRKGREKGHSFSGMGRGRPRGTPTTNLVLRSPYFQTPAWPISELPPSCLPCINPRHRLETPSNLFQGNEAV